MCIRDSARNGGKTVAPRATAANGQKMQLRRPYRHAIGMPNPPTHGVKLPGLPRLLWKMKGETHQ